MFQELDANERLSAAANDPGESLRILLIDEKTERDVPVIENHLKECGWYVYRAFDLDEGMKILRNNLFDAIIVGQAPVYIHDKIHAVRAIRENQEIGSNSKIPVIVIGHGLPLDVASVIDNGADDFIKEGFRVEVLAARLRAFKRRGYATFQPTATNITGRMTIDFRRCNVSVDGENIGLTATEYKIVACLMLKRGSIVKRSEIREYLGKGNPSNTVEVFIKRIRDKIDKFHGDGWGEAVIQGKRSEKGCDDGGYFIPLRPMLGKLREPRQNGKPVCGSTVS